MEYIYLRIYFRNIIKNQHQSIPWHFENADKAIRIAGLLNNFLIVELGMNFFTSKVITQ